MEKVGNMEVTDDVSMEDVLGGGTRKTKQPTEMEKFCNSIMKEYCKASKQIEAKRRKWEARVEAHPLFKKLRQLLAAVPETWIRCEIDFEHNIVIAVYRSDDDITDEYNGGIPLHDIEKVIAAIEGIDLRQHVSNAIDIIERELPHCGVLRREGLLDISEGAVTRAVKAREINRVITRFLNQQPVPSGAF